MRLALDTDKQRLGTPWLRFTASHLARDTALDAARFISSSRITSPGAKPLRLNGNLDLSFSVSLGEFVRYFTQTAGFAVGEATPASASERAEPSSAAAADAAANASSTLPAASIERLREVTGVWAFAPSDVVEILADFTDEAGTLTAADFLDAIALLRRGAYRKVVARVSGTAAAAAVASASGLQRLADFAEGERTVAAALYARLASAGPYGLARLDYQLAVCALAAIASGRYARTYIIARCTESLYLFVVVLLQPCGQDPGVAERVLRLASQRRAADGGRGAGVLHGHTAAGGPAAAAVAARGGGGQHPRRHAQHGRPGGAADQGSAAGGRGVDPAQPTVYAHPTRRAVPVVPPLLRGRRRR
jgi:hypothetical protein